MNFTCTADIKVPLEKAVALWKDPENFKKWQDGFISLEAISGNPGEVGSKNRLVYKMGRNDMELIETIQKNDLPEEFIGLYEHKHMTNSMRSSFTKIDENNTHYVAYIDYLKLNSFMIKVMFRLFPSVARKQTQKWIDQFKEFAEKEG